MLHKLLLTIGNVGYELVLLRRCADICKLTHLLRAAGNNINPTSLQNFDDQLNRTVSLIIGGSLHTEATIQASLGVQSGGLSLRHARDTALPAYIASKVAAKPIVARLASGLQDLDMLPADFECDYTIDLAQCVADFKMYMDSTTSDTIDSLISDEATFVEEVFRAVESGQSLPSRVLSNSADLCDLLVTPAGSEDPEREDFCSLQKYLLNFTDRKKAHDLKQHSSTMKHGMMYIGSKNYKIIRSRTNGCGC